MRLILPSGAFALATLLAACGTTAPVTVSGLEPALGASLIGVAGKTRDDSERISIRNARECAAGLWKSECK